MSSSATPTVLADITALVKELWTDIFSQAVNPNTPLKAQFAKLPNANFTGKKWIFAVKTRIGGGAANAGGASSVPNAATGTVLDGSMTPARTYTRFGLDGLLMAQSKSNRGAFKAALAFEMEDRQQAHDLEVNRQMFCNGDGVLCTIPTGTASATQTPGTGQAGAAGDYGVVNSGSGMTHVNVGDELAFYQSDKTTLIGRRTVASVTDTTMTLDSTITSTDGAVVTRSTADTDNLTAGEASGLLQACYDSGTFETIDPTSAGQAWKAIRLTNSGTLRPISSALVMQALMKVRTRSRQNINLFVTSPGLPLKYSETLLPLQRIDGQDAPLKGGYKAVAAVITNGAAIPVIDDPDCPKSRMFGLTTSTIQLADLLGTEWADDDGSIFFRIVGMDGIEGLLRKYWNLAYTQRNALCVIEDLEDYYDISRTLAS